MTELIEQVDKITGLSTLEMQGLQQEFPQEYNEESEQVVAVIDQNKDMFSIADFTLTFLFRTDELEHKNWSGLRKCNLISSNTHKTVSFYNAFSKKNDEKDIAMGAYREALEMLVEGLHNIHDRSSCFIGEKSKLDVENGRLKVAVENLVRSINIFGLPSNTQLYDNISFGDIFKYYVYTSQVENNGILKYNVEIVFDMLNPAFFGSKNGVKYAVAMFTQHFIKYIEMLNPGFNTNLGFLFTSSSADVVENLEMWLDFKEKEYSFVHKSDGSYLNSFDNFDILWKKNIYSVVRS